MLDMLLNKTFITFLLLFAILFSSFRSSAQDNNKSRTRYVIPYGHKVMAPPGMVYVRGGVTQIKYDQSSTDTNSIKKVSLTSFFIDKSEVTNYQYRQFVNWVIDSIAIVNYLQDDSYFTNKETDSKSGAFNGNSGNGNNNGLVPPAGDTSKPVVTAPVTDTTHPVTTQAIFKTADSSKRRINWSKVNHEKIWNGKNEKLAPMLDENGNIKKEYYNFAYKYVRYSSAANHNGKNNEIKTQTLNVYPNENVWNQDLTNAQTDLYVENYFKVPPFDDYPVVGVTWEQARAFCYWRSMTADNYYNMPDYMNYYHLIYTLPSEAQWVYAAQGYYDMIYAPDELQADTLDTAFVNTDFHDSLVVPRDSATVAKIVEKYSTDSVTAAKNAREQQKAAKVEAYNKKKKRIANGNMYVMDYMKMMSFMRNGSRTGNEGKIIDSTVVHRDMNGMLVNFKQDEGDYWEDGVALTTPVMSFAPNEFGLYNMEGNVAEWTMDAYSPSAYSFVSDLNPMLQYDADSTDADIMKRKVIRGGSFMSNAKSLSPYYRDMELQNVSHCFVGFRCVMTAPEVIVKRTSTRNKTQRGHRTPGKLNGYRLPEIR
jgi:formylglycine-generating enzyme required for sulfatase activity